MTKSYHIPAIVDENSDRQFDLFSKLLDERIVFAAGDVGEEMAISVVAQLLLLNEKNSKDLIHLYINSYGGSVYDGLAIIDTISFIKAPVATICVGKCMSMGALLLSSGKKGERYVLPNSTVMIHQVSSGTKGTGTDMAISLKETLRLKELLNRTLADNCNQDYDKVVQDTERDCFLSAKEAVAYGIADKITNK